MISPEHTHLFTKYQIFSERELQARQHIKYRSYIKSKQIELGIASNMISSDILPAILLQLDRLGRGFKAFALTGSTHDVLQHEIEHLGSLYSQIRTQCTSLDVSLNQLDPNGEPSKVAPHIAKLSRAELAKLRTLVDEAETLVARDLWPFTRYQDFFASI
jgi:glutamine synthetase type III